MGKRFYNQCLKVARLARELTDAQGKLHEMFEERYGGVTYNDVDEDWLIDCLDYGQGGLPTLAQIDRMMTDAGYPPHPRKQTP